MLTLAKEIKTIYDQYTNKNIISILVKIGIISKIY